MTSKWIYTRLPQTAIEAASRITAVATPQTAHFHDEVQIARVHAGWRSFVTPVGEYRAEAGDAVVIPAGMLHAPRMSERSSVSSLYLDPATPAASSIATPIIIRNAATLAIARVIELAAAHPRAGISAPESVPADRMRRVVASSDLPVAAIAESFELSTDGFIRAFRRAVGTTPGRYRQMHRLCAARSLLRGGAKPADAAFAAAFADQSHLGRAFLAAFGTTPAAYRAGLLRPHAVDFVPD